MASSSSSTKGRSTSAKSAARKGTKTSGRKSAAKTTKSTGRKTAVKTPPTSSRPASAPVLTDASAFATPEARLAAAKPGQLLVRRFDEHRELAQLATKRFQTTASRPGADPTKQSGVTTANVADIAAALKARKTTAEKLLGVPVADVIRYAEKGEISKRAETAELTKKLRDFSLAVFGTGTRNKLRGKRIAAALSVLMDGGAKIGRTSTSAAKSSATKSATKSTGRKSSTGRKGSK